MPEFNRYDICEAYSCLAHDFGLYALNTRLIQMGFKPRPNLDTKNLEENARDIYDLHAPAITAADAYEPKPFLKED